MWNMFIKHFLKRINMALYEFNSTIHPCEVGGIPIKMKEVSIDDSLDTETLRDSVLIAAAAFGVSTITPEFENDVLNHLKKHHLIISYSKSDNPLGFASLQYLANTGVGDLYVSGLVIKPEAQRHGLGTLMVTEGMNTVRKSGFPVDYVSGRTQNPVVAQARMHYCDPVFPITEKPSDEVLSVAHKLHSHLQMSGPMDQNTLVTRDVYPSPLNRDIRPNSKHDFINTFFNAHVGPRDAVFIIGKPKI